MPLARMDLAPRKLRRSFMFNAFPYYAPLELAAIGSPSAINISALRAFVQAGIIFRNLLDVRGKFQ